MNKRFSIITGATVFMVGIAGAAAAELPTYDMAGFPIMPHQMSVLGLSGAIQEMPTAPTLMRDGMPASPHQIAVLTPRSRMAEQAASRPIEAAISPVGIVTRSE